MAVVDKKEFMERLTAAIGTSDSDITLLEDFTDTFMQETDNKTAEEYEIKLKELDESWRKKYKERFSGAKPEDTSSLEEEKEEATKTTYDELFEKEEN